MLKKQPLTKVDITPSVISRFFLRQIPSKNTMKHKRNSWKMWRCLLVKDFHCWGLLNPFGCKGVYKLCLYVAFPSRNFFVEEMNFNLIWKTFVGYVQLEITSCLSTTCTFVLWKPKGAHDIFVVVVNFLLTKWEQNTLNHWVVWGN
jgi:hypothetical protein